MEATLSDSTKITAGLVILLLAAAVSYGVMYEKVNNVDTRMVRMEDKMDMLLEARGLTKK